MTTRKMTKKAFKDKEKRNEAKKSQTELLLPKIPKLSQSLVKALYKYKLKEECGLRIHASYIDGINFPSTEAQELGNYFEYKATGQLPRDGHTPQPILLKNGNPPIDYARMDIQVENFKTIMKRLNFTIEQTGFAFTNPLYAGITDIIAHDNNIKSRDKNKKRIIIDLKSSGLINDKWSPYGWADESIEEKWDLLIQAIHYKMLAKYEWGIEDIPFYFFVFSTKNEWEYKMFKVNVDADTMQQHYFNLKNIKIFLDETLKSGFVAHPKYNVCRTCPLSMTCKSSVDIPEIQQVFI
jgi:hypothetical protein